MCGIAGLLYFDGTPAHAEMVKRMNASLAHRGPDGDDVYTDGPVGLGQRRLAIIDLSPAGMQPMSNEDGTVWITFNGEMYNFMGIRRELEALGHQFRSNSDTETIVHAYEEWGTDCLHRFNGMFAFALWDARRQRLWLVRDRLGVKPMFYAHLPNRLLFGSEIKAILCDPGVDRNLDYEALSYYLALNYTPAPYTLFASVRQLLPGHYLTVDADGGVEDVEYWDLHYREDPYPDRAEQDYVEEFLGLLEDSVRLRLISDVPLGSFLSGGVDSSAVSYCMSRLMNSPVKTFSIGFQERTFNELDYARQVAQLIEADHHEWVVKADAAEVLPKIVWHSEEPTADSSMVAVYYLAQMARENVTVALSADGADECIAGYETYQAYYLHNLYRRVPAWLRNGVVMPLINALPLSDAKVSWDFKLRRFAHSADLSAEDAHATWRMIFNGDLRRQLLDPVSDQPGVRADAFDLYRATFARTNARHPLNRMLYVDTRFYLPNDMLVKVDRMSMAHGLEAREPFLDYRLVEFLASVPPNLKLKNFRHKKYLLKASMKGKLPDSAIWRKKAGFNLPNARWMKEDLKPFVTDHLSPRRIRDIGLFNPQVVDTLLSDHFQEKADNSHQIWCLLTLSLWWGQFVESTIAERVEIR
jgi:asparagine synthase (glutamine-hydrolysing)